MFQSLEGRVLLSLPVSNGSLTINGSAGNDRLEITQDAAGIITLTNLATGVADTSSAPVTSLLVQGNAGNDLLRLRKGDGSSAVRVPTVINGGDGNDTIIGGNGDDEIRGNDGDDLMDGRSGDDVMNGGIGLDTADYTPRGGGVVVTLDNLANDGSACSEQDNVTAEAVLGGGGADYLVGNSAANFFDGGGGNDTILGGAGDDSLTGGSGADFLFAQDGNDYSVSREPGSVDRLNDGAGTDSARVDAIVGGDPVDDVAAGSTIPANPCGAAFASAMSFASFASFAAFAGPSYSSFDDVGSNLDPSFGAGGKVVTTLDGTLAQINDVAVQSDGKIVVVGAAVGARGDYDFLIVRYNANGSLDGSFGTGGVVLTDFANGSGFNTDIASAVAIDGAGRLVVVGGAYTRADLDNSTLKGFADYTIARYLPNGQLDTSFDSDGYDMADVGGPQSDDRATGIAIQKLNVGGTIVEEYVVVGTAGLAFKNANPQFPTADFAMVRWNADGSNDGAFGTVRSEFGAFGVAQDYATAVAVDSTGKIWVAGHTGPLGGSSDVVLAGYTSGGALFTNSTPTDFGGVDQARGLVLKGDRALVVGSSDATGIIASYNISASDPFYAAGDLVNSTVVAVEPPGSLGFQAVGVDQAGLGVAVGAITQGAGDSNFFVYRFDTESLEGDGRYAVTDFGAADGAYALAVQADGKLVAAGLTGDDAALARYDLDRIAENLLSAEQEAALNFTYTEDGQTFALPLYLAYRLRVPISPDGVLSVQGWATDDLITVSQADGVITLTSNFFETSYDASRITKIVIHGLAGNDRILVDANVAVPVCLFGDEGNDTLFGGAANDELEGGIGNDVLVAAGGADVLRGGSGRDLLVGGLGSDVLNGNEDDDILIGGFTNYDRDFTALSAIMAEWTSTRSYSNRVASLNGTGAGQGLNGTYYLRPGSPTVKTVSDDSAVDQLFGGDGQDWFFVHPKSPADSVLDRTKGESTSNI